MKYQCHYPDCKRNAMRDWTTCPRHSSAGLKRSHWLQDKQQKQRAKRNNDQPLSMEKEKDDEES